MLFTGLAQLVEHWSPKPGVVSSNLTTRAKLSGIKMKKIAAYLKDSYTELVYKVSWPSREELSNSSVIVMIASLIIALVVFGIDSLFEWILKLLYGIL